jgi:GNAT superfamily N-acetyltransferase
MPLVRAATEADYPTFARLFPELGVPDPLPDKARFAERMLPRVVILEERGAGLGYAFWQRYGETFHVVNVVVDPAARGRGLGRALMVEVRERARGEACTRWYLRVKQDNVPAVRLYERSGMAIERETWLLDAAWSQLATLPVGGFGPAIAAAPSSEHDVEIARRLGTDVERISHLRGRQGGVLFALFDRGELVGFAAFDPSFPGINPIWVERVDLARSLFDAIRPHAQGDRVYVVVEGDRSLYEALRAVGAELQHALYQMGAAL